MMGDRISMLKTVLNELLSQLPNDAYFNVVSFGSSHNKMFSESVAKTDANV
jgi:hypothetical protein